jgi:hypothetical protein
MARRFGTTPPAGGKSLHEAALTLTSRALRKRYDQADKAASHALTAGQYIGKKKRRTSVIVRARLARASAFQPLRDEVLEMLRSGELQAIAMELGVVAEYLEVAAPHWKALTDIRWGESTVRRHLENSPLFHVLVYSREAYDKIVLPDSGEMPPPKASANNQTLKARIRDEFNAAPPDVRTQWRTKTEAAGWIRDRIDNRGDEPERRRHVLHVLEAELAMQFPNAPDGVTAK